MYNEQYASYCGDCFVFPLKQLYLMLAVSYSLSVYAILVFFVFFKVVVYGHLNDMLWRSICLYSIRLQVLRKSADFNKIYCCA